MMERPRERTFVPCSGKRFIDLDDEAKANEQGSRRTPTTAISWKSPGRAWQEKFRGQRIRPEGGGIIAKKAISFQKIIFSNYEINVYLYQREK
jgi:hypothetical protein